MNLYSNNAELMKEFAFEFSSQIFFPSFEKKKELRKYHFYKRLQEASFILLRSHDIRKRFTQFVIENKTRALLPYKPI